MKSTLLFLGFLLLGLWQSAAAQTPIDTTGGRFFQPIFPNVTVSSGVVYGSAVGAFGAQNLLMDVYQPTGDVATQRPVIIFAHEGGFVRGTRTDAYMTAVCTQFARLGYVTASIDYRLNPFILFAPGDTTGVSRAAIQAMQDMRAAVRFFRSDAATTNTYRVSPERIVVGGASAGGFMALQVGYLDKASEVTTDVNLAALGGIEGNSGSAGFNSFPLAVLNLSGATNPTSIIEAGNAPLYSAHGTSDAVVPYFKGRVGAGLPPKYVFGSGLLNPRASAVGVPNVLRRFSRAPHIPQYPVQSANTGSPNSAAYADTTYRDIRAFLRPLLVPVVAPGFPSLVINTPTTVVAGSYQDITVNSGTALLSGNITVYGTLTVRTVAGQPAGALNTNCFVVDGPGNFDLQAGAALRICDVAGISASGPTGAIRNTGSRTFSTDAGYAYEGTGSQATGTGLPAQVRELEVAVPAASALTMTNALRISQKLTPTSGTLNNSGQALTLLSGPAGTALVTPGAGALSAAFTLQRYLDPAVNPGLGYRHLGLPFDNGTFTNVSAPTFAPVFNQTYNGSARPDLVTPFPNVFAYDQLRIPSSPATSYSEFDKGWVVPPVQSPGVTLAPRRTQGYAVNIAAGQTLAITGQLTRNNEDIITTLFGAATPTAGWHLVGNPFPSALNWDAVPVPAGMSGAVYVFVSTSQYAGQYRAYVNGVGGAGATIPLGQAFFVRSLSTAGVPFVLPLSARINDFASANAATVQRNADARPRLRLTLAGAAAPAVTDETYLYLEAGATAGVDAAFDADKMQNPSGLNLASVAAGEQLAINALPVLTAPATVPLVLTVPQPGAYVLTAAQLANFAPGALTLVDALTGTRTALAAGTSYAFTTSSAAAPGRFTLELRPTTVTATSPAQALATQLQVYPNPASSSFRVELPLPGGAKAAGVPLRLINSLGQAVRRQQLTGASGQPLVGEVDVRGLAPGVYQLHLSAAGASVVRRVVVQ
ncbi:MAG TPA: alpha/beta hydrolase fold domain-containing protein [Hymenobacter sp.]|jgi:acetyl esterase/lipase|uniref:alpha/beta hydrolase fold domain-containing protein n=1 Tax=Hymenobacter sp. TaxID=1898978 RepID=UPI002EDA90EC